MKTIDRAEFLKIIVGVGAVYGKEFSETLLEVYWSALKDYELSDIAAALQSHIKNPDNGQFMPKPADVVKFIEGTSVVNGMQAWVKVLKSVKCIGRNTSIIFDDPIIHVVIEEMGGWIRLCDMREDDEPFKANEFEKRYARYFICKPKKYPKFLIGVCHDGVAQIVGDRQKAIGVFENGVDGEAEGRGLPNHIGNIFKTIGDDNVVH